MSRKNTVKEDIYKDLYIPPMVQNDEQEDTTVVKIKKKNNDYKEKICKVISYDSAEKLLRFEFENYGLQLRNVDDFSSNTVVIKYRGKIGTPNFEFTL